MNLLYVVPFWPSLYTPFLYREIAWMKQHGHRIAVVSLKRFPGGEVQVENFGLTDIPVLQIERQYQNDGQLLRDLLSLLPEKLFARTGLTMLQSIRQSGVRQGLHEWANLKRIVAFVRSHQTQVIDAHWAAEAGVAASQIKRATGVPYAVRVHGGEMYRSPSPHLQQIVEHAGAICCVSSFVASLLLGERPVPTLPVVPRVTFDLNKLRVCHNGLPSESMGTQPNAQSADTQVIGSIGRLDPEKRHADLIEAFAPLAGDFPGAKLQIVGGGRLHDMLNEKAKQLGIAERVEITGPVPYDKVMQLVRQMHIYVQAADVEGCSLATIEGAAQGVPVILSRTGAHEKNVDEGVNGYLFHAGDIPALREHLLRILSLSPEQRREMGRKSIEITRERFLFDTLMVRVEAILQAVRQGHPLPA